jgi:hypothetical protein
MASAKGLLVFDREPDDLSLLDGTVSGLLRRCDYEVAEAAPLWFGGALHHGERLGGNPRLDAGGAVRFRRHWGLAF